uniref:Phosphatidic acid phosphatase type 2/haloperoxidase domain-containing protein n=1 Tax=Monodelphis domestica TaxID=13616 RepID=F6V079_MONDO
MIIISGRLRPNFLAVCRPNWAHLDCMGGCLEVTVSPQAFPLTHCCRKSFLSDQAAFSTYCVVYLTLYLQARLIWEWSKHLRIILQIILLSLPLLVGYIQISDYWHHLSDVFLGFLQGMTTGPLWERSQWEENIPDCTPAAVAAMSWGEGPPAFHRGPGLHS